jgi:cathepsin L
LIGVAAASLEGDFQAWAHMYQKTYTPEEYAHRFAVWKANLAYVASENAKGNSWTVGMNKMADLTLTEYRALYLNTVNITGTYSNIPGAVTNVDWRTSGCVAPVKDQGQCGSCYAFSATAALEFCHCRVASLVRLSEQQCVDCSLNYGNLGCSGGWMENCWKYYIAFGGEDTEASYPYTAVRGTCKASTANIGGKLSSWAMCTASEAGLQACIVGHVTSVAIDAGLASFQLYSSGVYCPSGCSTTALNHAVTAVGQQTATTDYYIVKNSWGTGWGQAGYIWMCANRNNNCGICTHADYPSGCS